VGNDKLFLYFLYKLLGVNRFCADIKFMMGIETGWYWRLCWRFITPGLMTAVLIYMLLDMSALEYKGVGYPTMAHGKPKDTSPCI